MRAVAHQDHPVASRPEVESAAGDLEASAALQGVAVAWED